MGEIKKETIFRPNVRPLECDHPGKAFNSSGLMVVKKLFVHLSREQNFDEHCILPLEIVVTSESQC